MKIKILVFAIMLAGCKPCCDCHYERVEPFVFSDLAPKYQGSCTDSPEYTLMRCQDCEIKVEDHKVSSDGFYRCPGTDIKCTYFREQNIKVQNEYSEKCVFEDPYPGMASDYDLGGKYFK